MMRIAELGIHRLTIIIKASVLCGGRRMQTAEELPGGRHYSAPGSRKPSISQLLVIVTYLCMEYRPSVGVLCICVLDSYI